MSPATAHTSPPLFVWFYDRRTPVHSRRTILLVISRNAICISIVPPYRYESQLCPRAINSIWGDFGMSQADVAKLPTQFDGFATAVSQPQSLSIILVKKNCYSSEKCPRKVSNKYCPMLPSPPSPPPTHSWRGMRTNTICHSQFARSNKRERERKLPLPAKCNFNGNERQFSIRQ